MAHSSLDSMGNEQPTKDPFAVYNQQQQQPPTAQEIAKAMVEAQAEEREKQGTKNSNVLAVFSVLVLAPLGLFLSYTGSGAGGLVCIIAFVLVIVAAVMGSMAKR